MPGKVRELHEALDKISMAYDVCPDFVISNEIRNRDIRVGDYRLQYNPAWGPDFYKIEFNKNAEWDFDKTRDLLGTVIKHHRYELVYPKRSEKFAELVMKENPRITLDMLYSHHIILDRKGYEKRDGLHGMLEDIYRIPYEPYSYTDPHVEPAETKEDAEAIFPLRFSAAIDSNSITVSDLFLDEGSELVEEIARKFFNAKTE